MQLSVYDVQGRLVRTLEGGSVKTAGQHTSVWDGLDERGLAVSSGIYFYHLEVGDYAEAKRMVLIKWHHVALGTRAAVLIAVSNRARLRTAELAIVQAIGVPGLAGRPRSWHRFAGGSHSAQEGRW